jgi:hypothetical protein
VSPGDAPPAPGDIPPAAAARIAELERLLVEEHSALLVEQAHRQAADRVADTLERALRMLEARETPTPAAVVMSTAVTEPDPPAGAAGEAVVVAVGRQRYRPVRPALLADPLIAAVVADAIQPEITDP